MDYILYNSKSGSGNYNIKDDDNVVKLDVLDGINYSDFFSKLNEDDKVYLAGGDGTINHFINDIGNTQINNDIYLIKCGTGNDFAKDINLNDNTVINEYIKNLPTVTVNGKSYKFINGVGYGIDGYCCEEGDRLKEKSDKPVNYTKIAIIGLLFKYHRPNCKVIVDGKEFKFKKCYLAPTMKGRYYGGGMMVAPNQDRTKDTLTLVVGHSVSKLGMLMVFPNIFKGTHIESKKAFSTFEGKEIEVQFDRPTALQIDGETIKGVLSYKVKA